MEKKIKKIEAYAKCLQEEFVYLRRRFAMLEPMIYDEDFINERSFWNKHVGFHTVRDTLIFACAKDIANICHDGGDRVPSFRSIRRLLSDKNFTVLEVLRENYVVRKGLTYFLNGVLTQYVQDYTERTMRSVEFDNLHTYFFGQSESLLKSKNLKSFVKIRNMVSAHTQVRVIDGKYCINEIEDLGLEWDDMKNIIESIQKAVETVSLMCSIDAISLDALKTQAQQSALAFWNIGSEANTLAKDIR